MSFNFGDLISALRSGVFIKSVQTYSITWRADTGGTGNTGTASITAVNPLRAFVVNSGWFYSAFSTAGSLGLNAVLTDSTTVTASVQNAVSSAGASNLTAKGVVVEFY